MANQTPGSSAELETLLAAYKAAGKGTGHPTKPFTDFTRMELLGGATLLEVYSDEVISGRSQSEGVRRYYENIFQRGEAESANKLAMGGLVRAAGRIRDYYAENPSSTETKVIVARQALDRLPSHLRGEQADRLAEQEARVTSPDHTRGVNVLVLHTPDGAAVYEENPVTTLGPNGIIDGIKTVTHRFYPVGHPKATRWAGELARLQAISHSVEMSAVILGEIANSAD